jgi:hypothetical protein
MMMIKIKKSFYASFAVLVFCGDSIAVVTEMVYNYFETAFLSLSEMQATFILSKMGSKAWFPK